MSSSLSKSAVFRRRAAGFTLIELLSVMAIISILAVTTLPAIRGTLDGVTISGAAGVVESELSYARQVAMSRNLPVEVRFYKHDDGNGLAWRAVASVIPSSVSGATGDEWLSRGKVLPGNVIADDAQEYSTLISLAGSASTNAGPWTATESASAPGILRGKSYVGFRFRPDGSINLPNGQPWCLTLRSSTSRQSGSAPADNYVSIVLDSLTGRTMSYQP
ncbi:Verru_Chthon cassette protein D [Terrimicrobium sacchariphilum]|nr:Verru_Chthon cassette protein D [Terrimicrobium sacchariphilum]